MRVVAGFILGGAFGTSAILILHSFACLERIKPPGPRHSPTLCCMSLGIWVFARPQPHYEILHPDAKTCFLRYIVQSQGVPDAPESSPSIRAFFSFLFSFFIFFLILTFQVSPGT